MVKFEKSVGKSKSSLLKKFKFEKYVGNSKVSLINIQISKFHYRFLMMNLDQFH
jgi:hypothetical protein